MLARTQPIALAERVSRVTQSPERRRKLAQLHRDLGDGREFDEALEFLGGVTALGPDDLVELAKVPFRFFSRGRYSDGAYGVLYTARGHLTANREVAHYQRQFYNPPVGTTYRIRLQLISWELTGTGKDIRRFVREFPWLIEEAHAHCQELGAQARNEGLACLVAPSARHRPKGTTIPIFLDAAVSAGRSDGEVTFAITAGHTVKYRTRKFN